MNLEQRFKEETGFDAYADNDLRPKVPSDYYVEWLEEQLTIGGVSKSFYCMASNGYDGFTKEKCEEQCDMCKSGE